VPSLCDAERVLIVRDTGPAGKVRYRSWNKPRFVTEKADLEIAPGSTSIEGTGPCSHSIWTFTRGAASYVVSEMGCMGGEEPPGARGELAVQVGETSTQRWCCF